MATRLDIIRRAQVRVGDEPILSETAPGADTYVAIYDGVIEDLLSRVQWSFATGMRKLVRLTEPPAAHWRYAYQLPSDMLGALDAVYDRGDRRLPTTGFEVLQNRLATDAENVWVRYPTSANIALWPGYFVELVTVAVMSQIALSVREDGVLSSRLAEQAYGPPSMMGRGGLLGQAAARDAQSQPSPVIAEGINPLVDVRYGSAPKSFIG